MADERVWKEEVRVQGEALVEKVKTLVHEGNVRRIIVKNEQGDTVIELPLTIGVVGAVAAPMVAAVGGIAALASKWTVEIERRSRVA